MVWDCQCGNSNEDDWVACPKCVTHRDKPAPPAGMNMSSGAMNTGWDCAQCTFTNHGSGVMCGMCGFRRMSAAQPFQQQFQQPFQQQFQQPFQQQFQQPFQQQQQQPFQHQFQQPFQQQFQQPFQQQFQQPFQQQFQQNCQIQNRHPAPVAGWSPQVAPDNERRIVVLGRTGSGKSTTCNNILQAPIFKSDTSGKSVTSQCQRATCVRFGREIQLIDTPGLFDTGLTNAETTREIVRCVGMTAPGPHAFILITRIDRFTKEEQDTVEHFKNVFGPGMMRHLIVLFTRKDDLVYEGKTIHQFVQNVPQSMRELLHACGNRYVAFNNRGTPEEKNRDVQELVNLIDNIVLNNGGKCYTTEMYEEAEKAMKKREEQLKKEHEAKANMEKMKIRQEMETKMKEMERLQEKKLAQLKAELKKKEEGRANQHELEKLKLEVEAEKLKMEKELEVARRQAELDAHKKKMEIENNKPVYREQAREEVNRGKDVAMDLLKMGLEAVFREGVSVLFGMAKDSWSKNKSLKETHGSSKKSTASEESKSSSGKSSEGNKTDEAKANKTPEK